MRSSELLLCTGLDRTLLPNGKQPESPLARHRFAALVSHPAITLVFVSGRDRNLAERAITNYRLPRPDFVISDVGTNIYDLRHGGWDQWPHWWDEIASEWSEQTHRQLAYLLSDFQALRLQEQSKQNRFKLSYYVPLYVDNHRLHRDIASRLQQQGIAASLVWSVDDPAGIGSLDVLPQRATKLHALEFLRAYLDIPLADTLFAGDSDNDLPLLASPIPSVLVANAMPRVAADASAAARVAGNSAAFYQARGGFMGMNGNYSAGILEGIVHYHPQLLNLFDQMNSSNYFPGGRLPNANA